MVGGFIAPNGNQKRLGVILLGVYYNGELRHCGSADLGFSEDALKGGSKRMEPLFIDKCPFVNPPGIKEKVQWVRPELVCEIEYAELTAFTDPFDSYSRFVSNRRTPEWR